MYSINKPSTLSLYAIFRSNRVRTSLLIWFSIFQTQQVENLEDAHFKKERFWMRFTEKLTSLRKPCLCHSIPAKNVNVPIQSAAVCIYWCNWKSSQTKKKKKRIIRISKSECFSVLVYDTQGHLISNTNTCLFWGTCLPLWKCINSLWTIQIWNQICLVPKRAIDTLVFCTGIL